MKFILHGLFRFLPLAFWMAIILGLSLHSSPPRLDFSLVSWDKFQHAAAYFVLTALAGYALLAYFRWRSAWLLAFATAVLFGGLLELAQGAFSTVRAAEWMDLAADAVGAGAVLIVVRWLRPLFPPAKRL
ncbi:MAG: VanZ family protein [Desulfuromonadales bacterium]|jgi:VanZ family protein